MGSLFLYLLSTGLIGYVVKTLKWVLITGPKQVDKEQLERKSRLITLNTWYDSLPNFYDVEPEATIPDTIVEFTPEVFPPTPQSHRLVDQILRECYTDLPGSTILYNPESGYGPPPKWIQDDINRVNKQAKIIQYKRNREIREKYSKGE